MNIHLNDKKIAYIKKTLTLLLALTITTEMKAGSELRTQGSATQLFVNGKPMLVLGSELSNSAATSIADIDSVMPRMRKIGLNTVFVPAQWDLLEPEEGKFDFALIDETINKARENNLKVIFLWFGAWKNSMSCYAPLWFKENTTKFPRAITENGKQLEIASAFSDNVLQADKKAFLQLISHIKDVDEKQSTVIMIQVENEIGMLESARDHSSLAEKAYKEWTEQGLDKKLAYEDNLSEEYLDEIFQTYHYARYVEQLASEGKKIYNIPMFVNAALNSRGRKPGQYPSAGPLAHLIDIWKKQAPSIDIYTPDIYDAGFKGWVAKYKRKDNPFFTPETRLDENSGAKAMYVFGETEAIGFSTFAIDQADRKLTNGITESYDLLRQLSPIILKYQGKNATWGLLFDEQEKERIIEDKENLLTCRHYFTLPWDPRATDGSKWPEGGAIIIRLAKNEYLIAGTGVVVAFQTKKEHQLTVEVKRGEDGFAEKGNQMKQNETPEKFSAKRLGIGYVDQVNVDDNGKLLYIRRDNGDQDHQGRHARISCGEYKILHVKLYEY